jgi:hypothetical protein
MGSQRLPLKIIVTGFLVRILGANRERDSAAGGELRGHDRVARSARFHEIVQNAVRDGFVERVFVSIRRKIKFEGLAFDTETVRHVVDVDPGEIRLARDRANGSEIIRLEMNPIIAAGCWIWKRLESRLGWRSGNSRFAVPKQC